ncbi:MAG: hypothetical protein WBO96_01600 [Enterococcus aquimarinus]
MNYMLSVNEAVNQLKEAGIISNPEILRRRLRAGKVKRAFIESNRHGWKIPEETISNIVTANEDKSSNKEYDKGYQDGYDAALIERKAKIRQLVTKGGYDEQFSIYRQDFRELAPTNTEDYLQFTDDAFFKWGVKTSRKTIQDDYLEGWFSFDRGASVLFQEDYALDTHLGLEPQALQCLGEYFRRKFIATKSDLR